MDYTFLADTPLFSGMNENEIREILPMMKGHTRKYEKDELIFRAGDVTHSLGLILSGSINIESNDIWGSRSILGHFTSGQIFAETYASIPGEHLLVDVSAAEKTEILFLNISDLFGSAGHSSFPLRLIQNLLHIFARKSLDLSRHIRYTSPKTIRGRLLSFFSNQILRSGSYSFTIPFDRQQLADFLNVDRSALSSELSKMQADGLITFKKNTFTVKQTSRRTDDRRSR